MPQQARQVPLQAEQAVEPNGEHGQQPEAQQPVQQNQPLDLQRGVATVPQRFTASVRDVNGSESTITGTLAGQVAHLDDGRTLAFPFAGMVDFKIDPDDLGGAENVDGADDDALDPVKVDTFIPQTAPGAECLRVAIERALTRRYKFFRLRNDSVQDAIEAYVVWAQGLKPRTPPSDPVFTLGKKLIQSVKIAAASMNHCNMSQLRRNIESQTHKKDLFMQALAKATERGRGRGADRRGYEGGRGQGYDRNRTNGNSGNLFSSRGGDATRGSLPPRKPCDRCGAVLPSGESWAEHNAKCPCK